ncbi:MAG: hypothetical protein FJZ58_01855 [Chlamydiae bacterium]|nr:hypothetical protein [Chlamydiota bacterium]
MKNIKESCNAKVLKNSTRLFFLSSLSFIVLVCSAFYTFKDDSLPPTPDWMIEQIQEDLAPFIEQGISRTALDQYMQKEADPLMLAKITIKDHVLSIDYPRKDGLSADRAQAVMRGLQLVHEQYSLPDMEFIVSMHDALNHSSPVPIFVFAKERSQQGLILFPDFESLGGSGNQLMQQTQQANKKSPWKTKIPRALWRGGMTGGLFTKDNFLSWPRTQAVMASLQTPDLINARFVRSGECRECQGIFDAYPAYFDDFIPLSKQIPYKYQLLIDGHSCAYSRAFWQLFSNCVILKQESDSIQWYYRALLPYEHYIPIAHDLHDLQEAISWALDHDKEAKCISLKAQQLAQETLSYDRILFYVYLLLSEYAKLQQLP